MFQTSFNVLRPVAFRPSTNSSAGDHISMSNSGTNNVNTISTPVTSNSKLSPDSGSSNSGLLPHNNNSNSKSQVSASSGSGIEDSDNWQVELVTV